MPLVRFTAPKDVRRFGSEPVEVPEVTARRVLADRRAVLVATLAEVTPSDPAVCDDGECGVCERMP